MSRLLRRPKDHTPSPGTALVASSTAVDLQRALSISWDAPAPRQAWQREIYRLAEIVGEVDYAARSMGSAVSRARLYIADRDANGTIKGDTTNPKAKRICDGILGGQERRQEEMQLAGYNLFLAGESYLLGHHGNDDDDTDGDQWFFLSINDFSRRGGKLFVNPKGKKLEVRPSDILRRVWLPDPNCRVKPKGPSKPARLVMRELEILTKDVFARADSRLAGAGMLLWPAGTVTAGSQTPAADDVTKRLVSMAAESLKGTGTAESVVPIVVEVPVDAMDKVRHISFATEQQKISVEQRSECVQRLATQLDLEPEQLTGYGQTNHWSAWYISASSADAHVKPILSVLCEVLWEAWVKPSLIASGLDPKRYALCSDIAGLIVRPQLLKDTLDLYERGIVSAAEVLRAGNYLVGAAASDEESAVRFLREVVLRDPQQLNSAAIRKAINVTSVLPEDEPLITTSESPPPPPPAPERATGTQTLPTTPETGGDSTIATEQGITASAQPVVDPVTVAIADAAITRTLELVGGRLLTRQARHQFTAIPRSELYLHIPYHPDRIPTLVEGSGTSIVDLAGRHGIPHPNHLASAVGTYCAWTLRTRTPHTIGRLTTMLAASLRQVTDDAP